MIAEIMKEKISADHLLYVSLKYTKTCDVILNLISRWQSMIEISFDALLEKAVKIKKIPSIPQSPRDKILSIKKIFKTKKDIQDAVDLYLFFRRIPDLEKRREGEFRKNLNLKVIDKNKITEINLETLKEYSEKLEKFISGVKHFLSD